MSFSPFTSLNDLDSKNNKRGNMFKSCVSIVVSICAFLSIDSFGANPKTPSNQVELTGTIEIVSACYETYHEELTYLVQPGKDKFSGIRHQVNIPENLKNKLIPGKTVTIKGRKEQSVTKKMTKGEVRKIMAKHIKNGEGIPVEVNGMDAIVEKIVEAPAAKNSNNQHNHGEISLKPVADDNEIVEVTIPAHIVVETIKVN